MHAVRLAALLLCSYGLMMKCWNEDAELRPTFSELVAQLSTQLGVMADYLDFSAHNSTDDLLETEL